MAPDCTTARIKKATKARPRPHQKAVKPPRAAASERGGGGFASLGSPCRDRSSLATLTVASPPTAPTTPPATSGSTNAHASTGSRAVIPRPGNPSRTTRAAIAIGTAKPGPTADPAIAAARGCRSRPLACAAPARNARITTAIVSAPTASSIVAVSNTLGPPPGGRAPRTTASNGTRTLVSAYARPTSNHDHGLYLPLMAYSSQAIACEAAATGRKTRSAPRRRPPRIRAGARVSGGDPVATPPGPAGGLIIPAAPPRSERPRSACVPPGHRPPRGRQPSQRRSPPTP